MTLRMYVCTCAAPNRLASQAHSLSTSFENLANTSASAMSVFAVRTWSSRMASTISTKARAPGLRASLAARSNLRTRPDRSVFQRPLPSYGVHAHRFVVPSALVSVLRAEHTTAVLLFFIYNLRNSSIPVHPPPPFAASSPHHSAWPPCPRGYVPYDLIRNLLRELADTRSPKLLHDPTALRVVLAQATATVPLPRMIVHAPGSLGFRCIVDGMRCHEKQIFSCLEEEEELCWRGRFFQSRVTQKRKLNSYY